MTAALTALAFVVPLAIFWGLRPRRSIRSARLRSALMFVASAAQLGGAVYFQSVGDTRLFLLFLVCGVVSAISAASILLRNRAETVTAQYPLQDGYSQDPRTPR
jgi:hypothetical protein